MRNELSRPWERSNSERIKWTFFPFHKKYVLLNKVKCFNWTRKSQQSQTNCIFSILRYMLKIAITLEEKAKARGREYLMKFSKKERKKDKVIYAIIKVFSINKKSLITNNNKILSMLNIHGNYYEVLKHENILTIFSFYITLLYLELHSI